MPNKKLKKKFAEAGMDSIRDVTRNDPFIPKNPEAWAAEGSNLTKPSKGWADLIEKKGAAAGYQGAKGNRKKKKTAKKPF
tara:strand:- start:28996 stop:29235 length:240 start_codon:yes stop_codon:yes gene_type:complete